MNNHTARAEAVFTAALTQPELFRSSFLARVCGNDTILRATVDALLVAHRNALSPLDLPAMIHAGTQFERDPGALFADHFPR